MTRYVPDPVLSIVRGDLREVAEWTEWEIGVRKRAGEISQLQKFAPDEMKK